MMNADQLLKRSTEKIDKTICDFGVQVAQHLLDAGAPVDELPRLMRPIVERLAQWRAGILSQLRARAARIRVIEAQIERLDATVH